jgi:hypothetical protein
LSADVNEFINNEFKQINSITQNNSEDDDFDAQKSIKFQIEVDTRALENLIKNACSEANR